MAIGESWSESLNTSAASDLDTSKEKRGEEEDVVNIDGSEDDDDGPAGFDAFDEAEAEPMPHLPQVRRVDSQVL